MENRNPPNSTNDKSKGKEKEGGAGYADGQQQPAAAATASASSPNGASVFSRIGRSAAGLGRDLVAGQPAGGDLASLTSQSKAGPSGASAAGPRRQDGEGSSSLPTAAAALGPRAGSSFASGHTEEHIAQQEQDFSRFLDSANMDMSIPPELQDGGLENAFALPLAARGAQAVNSHTQSSDVAAQERHDGEDVVNILAWGAEDEPDYENIELAESEIEGLRRALFGSEADADANGRLQRTQEWDSVLNLIPDFIRPNADGYENDSAAAGNMSKSGESHLVLGVPNSSETARLWLDQWHDVLTRYTEEVWGGLAPLVVKAREEVDELQASPIPAEPPSTRALHRLRQILGHLRDS